MVVKAKYTTAEEALKCIKSGDRVFVHGSAATPHFLIKKLTERADELRNVEMVFISLLGKTEFAEDRYKDSFAINALFVSEPIRDCVNHGNGNFVPIFLSEIPDLFKSESFTIDVALIHISPPDAHGYCSLGVSIDIARTAVNTAKYVIAQVNPQMPRTHGDGLIHIGQIDSMVHVNEPLPEVFYECEDSIFETIGKNVAGLIEDGSTLQLGIGGIPNAVLSELTNHKNLGVHTEMFSDGLIPLIENGVVNNTLKKKHPGKVVTGFCIGSHNLYKYVDDNPMFEFLDIDYVNEPNVIKQNQKVCAINSCIEIDLTGQVCSDSIGTYQYSGVGGQMDFMRGAALSKGGKPILALGSRTNKGVSRIVPFLKQGAGVVTTRAHVQWVVTEFGVVNLFGKNLRQRGKELINIAHPDDREMLERAYFERFKQDI